MCLSPNIALAHSPLNLPHNAHQKCTNATETDIAALFDKWNAALGTRDPDTVADRYAPDSVLLSTLSNKPRTDRAGKLEYFEDFLTKKPVGTINSRTITIGCDTAVDAGTYTFALTDKKTGAVANVPARYTYTYAPVGKNGEWLITSHHSSGMPEKPEPASA